MFHFVRNTQPSGTRPGASGSWSFQSWYSACRVRSSAKAAAHRAGRGFARRGGRGGGSRTATGSPAARRSRKAALALGVGHAHGGLL